MSIYTTLKPVANPVVKTPNTCHAEKRYKPKDHNAFLDMKLHRTTMKVDDTGRKRHP